MHFHYKINKSNKIQLKNIIIYPNKKILIKIKIFYKKEHFYHQAINYLLSIKNLKMIN